MTLYFDELPNLRTNGFDLKSNPSETYNCIAWAAGVDSVIWDPDEDQYWPPTKPRDYSIEAIVSAFEYLGFESRAGEDESHELEIQKVAIYGSNGIYDYAARQLSDGQWTSKLGNEDDIRHPNVSALADGHFGQVIRILRRPYPSGAVLGDG